jgi:hypothetical protein
VTESRRGISTLTEKTFLPIGLVAIALVACCGGAWWLSAMYANQVQMNSRLHRIEHALADNSASMVTERDMRIWVMTLKSQNDTLKIPDWVH